MDEEFLVNKLRGHQYDFSVWQYLEAKTHIDPEMMYVVTHHVTRTREDKTKNGKITTVNDVAESIGQSVFSVITERSDLSSTNLNPYAVMRNTALAYNKFTGVKPLDINKIIDEFIIYAIVYTLVIVRYIKL